MPYTSRRHHQTHTLPKNKRNRRSNADANISCLILTLIVLVSVFLSANGYAYISAVRTAVSAYGA